MPREGEHCNFKYAQCLSFTTVLITNPYYCNLAETHYLKIYIVIPAHNEAEFIGKTLQSLVEQSFLPSKIVVVDDQSSDNTAEIVSGFVRRYPFISLVKNFSSEEHVPGSKVINAFHKGYQTLDQEYDILCKFDADLIFPQDYLETIRHHFQADPKIGMAGGFCSVLKNRTWILENLTGSDHLRGALKAYRKACFLSIGKLKPAMGWDTVDELLAQYHGWSVKTDKELLVQHLRPTGASYSPSSRYRQGEAFYRLGYGFVITCIASAKLAYLKKDLSLFKDFLYGYFKAKKEKQPFLVTKQEGRFIRKLRWDKMRKKILGA